MNISEIKEIIISHKPELLELIDQDSADVRQEPFFKILYEKLLPEFHNCRVNEEEFYYIMIEYTNLTNLKLPEIKENLYNVINQCLKKHNYYIVDSEFNILSKEIKLFQTNKEAKNFLEKESNIRCIFVFNPEGVTCFINGKCDNKINFFSKKEFAIFSKRKSITEIESVFDDYTKKHLIERAVYSKFFISKNKLIEWFGDPNYRKESNILKNKPEDLFQSDLYEFLKNNLIHEITLREVSLPTKKRLDIFTEENGKDYFFEIKWLGRSVKKNEIKDDYTEYTDNDIRDGINQTLNYIKELIDNMDSDIGCGYLIVFDARGDNREIDYKDFDFIPSSLQPYYDQHFDKFDNIIVNNLHPQR